ncbi:hypothetical protein HELRODRAFT_180986 [Helobdella robusta]|uniref:Uncharacterized protein n=1 Tax=Helobdella robusta TaxID=6412 RepID=T1FGI0_HELRO|nr:hypothetical protein HELRODRAFT_180986 [Helobdella robusta]ESN93446.1 hypothetical protein HELRODRAFT_180986 [Helobdella robusta]
MVSMIFPEKLFKCSFLCCTTVEADVNKIESGGSSPLMEATRIGNLHMCELLVSNGADVNQPCPNYNNATPIIIAAIFNRAEVASFLSDNRAKLDLETSDKRCALTEAFRNDNLKIVETVLRGSLGQSFADRTSFTYSMVVKYQRPDKNMNTILKLIGEELKQQDEARKLRDAELKKKLQKSNSFTRQQSELYHNWEKKKNIANNSKNNNNNNNNNSNLNNNNNNKNSNGTSSYSDEDYANINEVKKVSNVKDVQFVKIDENIIEEQIQKVSKSELNALPFNDLENMKKTTDTSSSNINNNARSNFDGFKPILSTFKNTLEVNKNQLYEETASKVKNVFDENAKKMQEKFSTSISDVGKRLNDDMQKPIQNLINDTSASFKSALDNEQNEAVISVKPVLSNFQPPNQQQRYHQQYYPLENHQQHYQQPHYPKQYQQQQYLHPQNRYIDDPNDFRSNEEAEDWEDETGFQEQYYPASSLENEGPGLMTTPILGRCAQVRYNYAQADLYLRDVVKTGSAPRFNVKSSLGQIRHLDNVEQDE